MFEAKPPSAGEVRALAQQLLSWADQLALAPAAERALSEEELQDCVLALAVAGRDIAHLRARTFPDTDFASTGWDVMLEIFIRQEQGQRVSLEQLAADDGWPPLAVHRSVNMLIDKQLVARGYKDPGTREVWLSLTDTGKHRMAAFLLESARFSRPPVLGGTDPSAERDRNPA
jgi:DNA-binding MarR family transcriptional regulator